MVCCWAKERFGYHFTIVHRSNKMTVNADALTGRFGHIISHNIAISDLLISRKLANNHHMIDCLSSPLPSRRLRKYVGLKY